MKIVTKKFVLFLIFLHIFPVLLYSQSFEKSVLIDIPGDNYDFDILPQAPLFGYSSYITWINRYDSIYTVYLKRISPGISDTNIVIAADNIIKSKPEVSGVFESGLKVVWQNFTGNYFQIAERNYINDSLTTPLIIQDSLIDDPQISLSTYRIAWVMDNKLYVREFYPVLSDPILVDSFECAYPDILKEDGREWTQIIYERIINENHHIYFAEYDDFFNPPWTYELISDGNNMNPDFGVYSGISFETIIEGISRIEYSPYSGWNLLLTENTDCNYKNPNVFSYDIPTDRIDDETPFFVAFDTDSLENNNEVFIKTFYFGSYDSLINISDMEGDDYKPKTTCLSYNGTDYAAVIWMHSENSKTDIWMATTVFNPIWSVVNENIDVKSFDLLQNYPNPFNPATNIEYYLERGSEVKVNVFDILGSHIATIVNEYKTAGRHIVIFNGSKLSSGIYLYSIELNGMQKIKAMVLLK